MRNKDKLTPVMLASIKGKEKALKVIKIKLKKLSLTNEFKVLLSRPEVEFEMVDEEGKTLEDVFSDTTYERGPLLAKIGPKSDQYFH